MPKIRNFCPDKNRWFWGILGSNIYRDYHGKGWMHHRDGPRRVVVGFRDIPRDPLSESRFRFPPMKLSKALSLLTDLRLAITVAILPTLRDVFHEPTLLFRPQALSRVFMAHLWLVFGDGADTRSRDIKYQLINPNAYGSVLDVGAGLCLFKKNLFPHFLQVVYCVTWKIIIFLTFFVGRIWP